MCMKISRSGTPTPSRKPAGPSSAAAPVPAPHPFQASQPATDAYQDKALSLSPRSAAQGAYGPSLQHLDTTLEQALHTARPPLSPEQAADLRESLQALSSQLSSGLSSPTQRQHFSVQLSQFSDQLRAHGLMKGPLQAALKAVVQTGIVELGKSQGVEVKVPHYRQQPLGLSLGPGQQLNDREMMQQMNAWLAQAASFPIPPGPLTGDKLLLLGLRDQISRLLYEGLLPPLQDTKAGPTVLEDEKLLLETNGLVDQLLQSREAIPADLLQDLTALVDSAKKAGGQGLQQAFNALNNAGQQASQAGQQLSRTSGQISNLISNLTSNLNAPNAVTPTANLISAYSTGSNAARAALPPLPFPLTMPTTLNIPLGGGNNMTIPAGSTLSYSPATGYTINSNGFGLNSGGTQVTSSNGTIVLGNTLDQLSFNTLNVNSGSTQVGLTGASVQVNKAANSSLIQAQSMNVNMGSGQVSLNNAQIIQTPNALQLSGNQLNYTNGTDQLTANQLQLGQTVNGGNLTTAGQLQGINGQFSGTALQASQLNFQLNNNADGSNSLVMTGQNVNVQSGANALSMQNAVLNLQSADDGSSTTTLLTQNGSWQNGNQSVTSTAAGFQLAQDASGNLTGLSAMAQNLNYSNGSDQVAVSQGTLNLSYGPNNQVSQISTQLGQVNWANADQWASASNVAGNASFGPNSQLQQLQLSAGQVNYGNPDGTLQLNGGQLTANYDANGQFQNAQLSGDSVSYLGKDSKGQPLNLSLGTFEGNLSANPNGGQTLSANAQNLQATLGKTNVAVDNIQSLQVVTGADGQVESLHLHAPQASQIQTEKLATTLNNVEVNYAENALSASVESLQGQLNDPQGLTGQFDAQGLQLWDTSTYTSLHLDSASADFKKLGEQYGLNVQNVDLVLDKNALGQISGGELRFADLQAQLKQYTLTGTTQDGKQMVMSFGMSEDGKWLQQMALEIPKGGELKVNKGEDWFLKLGESQQFEMNYDEAQKGFTLAAHNFNAQYGSKDMLVDISGLRGNPAELKLSMTEEGGVVIDDISNVSGKVTLKGVKGLKPIEIDIDKIKGYSSKNLGMQTTNKGMMLYLKPDGPDSKITAEIRTSYNGIPLGMKLNNVHEFKAGFEAETNRAQVYIGDPSGRGQIEIYAGPLKLKGAEIQAEAQYHPFDTQRMLNSLDKLSSDNGIRVLGDYVVLDPIKGKLTLDTGNDRGPYLQTNFMFESPIRALARETGLPMFQGVRPDAFGMTLGLGARWTHGDTRHQLGLDAGLLPGSYVSLEMQKGHAYLGPIQLPDYMTLGTTPYAGLNYQQRGTEHRLSTYAGAFANPAALVQGTPYLAEDKQHLWGVTAGVKYQTGDFHIGAQYIGSGPSWNSIGNSPGPNKAGWTHGATLNAGFSF